MSSYFEELFRKFDLNLNLKITHWHEEDDEEYEREAKRRKRAVNQVAFFKISIFFD